MIALEGSIGLHLPFFRAWVAEANRLERNRRHSLGRLKWVGRALFSRGAPNESMQNLKSGRGSALHVEWHFKSIKDVYAP